MVIMELCAAIAKEKYREHCHLNAVAKSELVLKERKEHFIANGISRDCAKRNCIAYGDVFTEPLEERKEEVRRVLIEGGTGTGKTTFCISVSKGWANGELFQQYELLLFLPLNQQEIASVSSLSELIGSLKLQVNSQTVARDLVKKKGERVLVVADGWNDLHESKRVEGSFLHKLLFGDTLCLASVIVTSRPTASAPLHKSTFVDRFLEICGFNKENIEKYIRSNFFNDHQIANYALEQMDSNPLLQSLCRVPLCCTTICHMCRTSTEVLPGGTMTNLCTKLVLKILNHNIAKSEKSKGISSLPEIDALPKRVQESWWCLCKVAFQTIEKSHVDLTQFQSFQYGIQLTGLVEFVPENDGVSFHFLHPTFQEYLAAVHIVKQPTDIPLKASDSIKFQQFMDFWRYVFGLCTEKDHKSFLMHAIQPLAIDEYSKSLLCQCAFEAENSVVTSEVIKSLFTKVSQETVIHFGDPHTALDCEAILFVMSNLQGSECVGMVINFKACSLSSNQINKLTDILAIRSDKFQVKELDLSDNNLPDDCVTDLFVRAMPAFRSLEKLYVRNNNIEEEGIQAIMKALSCQKVKQLDLSFNRLAKGGLHVLQNAIISSTLMNLEILFMQGSLTKDARSNVQFLITFSEALLSNCQHLRRLDLSGNDLGEPGTAIRGVIMQLSKVDLILSREYLPEVDKSFIAIMEDSIRRKGTIDHTVVHGVIVGPGRSGKNSLMNRLMGEGPPDPNTISPSTGVLENIVKVEVKKLCTVAATVNKKYLRWKKLDYDEEALEIMMTTARTHTASEIGDKAVSDITSHSTKEKVSSAVIVVESQDTDVVPDLPPRLNETLEVVKGSVVHTRTCEVRKSVLPFSLDASLNFKEEGPMDIFKRAVKLRRMDALRERLESSWSLYLTNTGGQTEFQELLPLLVCGPSAFFITFPLNQNLHDHYTVYYQFKDSRQKSYRSTTTLIDEILQTLATIVALVCTGFRTSVRLKPKIFFIGTHKDQLPQSRLSEIIKKIDEQLQKALNMPTFLFDQGLLEFEFAEGREQLIFTVNNLSKDDADFQKIRLALQQAVERCDEFTIRCPSTWLIFSLILRAKHKASQVLSYNDCFTIAQRCGISDRAELNDALFFIHTRLGLVRYFCVKELNKLVVIDPQILFDTITKLIVNTFVNDHAKVSEIAEFEEKGMFSMEVIERISKKNEFECQLPLKWLLELLTHLRIAADFMKEGKKYYFFPCVLCRAPVPQPTLSLSHSIEHEPPPLLIAFESGFCPRGIPGAIIKYLMTNEMESEIEWELNSHEVFRNQVSFNVGPCGIVLKIFPTHLQISFDPESEATDSSEIQMTCHEAYTQFRQAMKTVTKGYCECKYFFAFYCIRSGCKSVPHPAEIKWEEKRVQCKINGKRSHLPPN